MDLEDWKLRKLPTASSARKHSFHALMDEAYSQVDAMLLRAGMFDMATDRLRSLNLTTRGDAFVWEARSVRPVDMHYASCSVKCWSVWKPTGKIVLPNSATLEVKYHVIFENFNFS